MKFKSAFTWSGAFLLCLCVCAIFAPWLARFSFDTQDMDHVLTLPNRVNWFGTDGLGRDLFSRVLFGARVSLTVGIVTSVLALVTGTLYGAAAGYFNRYLGPVLMAFVDFFQALPQLVLMILVSVIFNAWWSHTENSLWRDTLGMIVALSVVGWMSVARLVRNQVLQIKELPFVLSAQASGAGWWRLFLKHILPNMSGSLLVTFTFLVPSQILYESFLSFIGLGLQPPYSSWGVLASEGWRSFRTYPHLILFPGGAIFLTMLACQLWGDHLRDLFDPHYRD